MVLITLIIVGPKHDKGGDRKMLRYQREIGY